MKKIIIIFIVLFCFNNRINAEVYYGDYRLVDDIGNYNDDTLKLESKKLYNTYEIKYKDMGYMLENNEYIKDENDFKEEYIDISINDIGDEYINVSTNIERASQIIINNLTDNMKIYEMEIYVNNEKFNYSYMYSEQNIMKKINDNNLETYLTGEEIKRIYVHLNYNNSLENTEIILYTNDIEDYELSISFLNENIPLKLHNKNKNKHIISFKNNIENNLYEYKGNKTLYRYYKEDKILLNNYVESGENVILEDYKEKIDYYIRDKLILKDNFIIDNYDRNIIDIIEYSTDMVNINCNINYNVNGLYDCEFILNDIKVNKDILVNIPIKEEMVFEKNENNNIVNNKIKKKIKNKNEKLEVKILSNEITTTKNVKENNNTTYKYKKINKNKLINIIKYIILINLIIIEIMFFIKKNKK